MLTLCHASERWYPEQPFNWTPASVGVTNLKRDNVVNKTGYVYIMANKRNGTLYVGVTSNLIKRVWEHKNNVIKGFTQKYQIHLLVWYEIHQSIYQAIAKEKQIKAWNRSWKLEAIEEMNSDWRDLYEDICH